MSKWIRKSPCGPRDWKEEYQSIQDSLKNGPVTSKPIDNTPKKCYSSKKDSMTLTLEVGVYVP